MARKIVVYIAGAYRGAHECATFANIMRARDCARTVWDSPGFIAFCPHLNTMLFGDGSPADKWLAGDLEILSRCDAILLMEDWQNSEGAIGERNFAVEVGLPCFESLAQLKAHFHGNP